MQSELDAHARPTSQIQDLYKQYHSRKFDSSDTSLDFKTPNIASSFKIIEDLDARRLNVAFQRFTGKFEEDYMQDQLPTTIFESRVIPGSQLFLVLPS